MPANADTLARFPLRDARSHGIDNSDSLMPWHSRVLHARPKAFLDRRIAMADAASLESDPHPVRFRLRNGAFHEFKRPARTGNLRDAHR
jgi:hypothetical protein